MVDAAGRTFRHEQDVVEQVVDLGSGLQQGHEHRAAAQVGEVAQALDNLIGGAAVQACSSSLRRQVVAFSYLGIGMWLRQLVAALACRVEDSKLVVPGSSQKPHQRWPWLCAVLTRVYLC